MASSSSSRSSISTASRVAVAAPESLPRRLLTTTNTNTSMIVSLLLLLALIPPVMMMSTTTTIHQPASAGGDDPDIILEYYGRMRCAVCEALVENATNLHYTTPMGSKAKSTYKMSEKQTEMRTLESRNVEILDNLCDNLLAHTTKSGDMAFKTAYEKHCDVVMEQIETKLLSYMRSLYTSKRPQKRGPDGWVAHIEDFESICPKLCAEKYEIQRQVNEAQAQLRQQADDAKKLTFKKVWNESLEVIQEHQWYFISGLSGFSALFIALLLRFVVFGGGGGGKSSSRSQAQKPATTEDNKKKTE